MASLPTILVVDDDPHIRKMLSEALSLEGYTFETAANGQEGLALLSKANGPRVILLDLLMAPVNGREFMEQLRANPGERARHKIVFISAIDRLESHRDLEPDAVIAKPFNVNDLFHVLENIGAAA